MQEKTLPHAACSQFGHHDELQYTRCPEPNVRLAPGQHVPGHDEFLTKAQSEGLPGSSEDPGIEWPSQIRNSWSSTSYPNKC